MHFKHAHWSQPFGQSQMFQKRRVTSYCSRQQVEPGVVISTHSFTHTHTNRRCLLFLSPWAFGVCVRVCRPCLMRQQVSARQDFLQEHLHKCLPNECTWRCLPGFRSHTKVICSHFSSQWLKASQCLHSHEQPMEMMLCLASDTKVQSHSLFNC